MSTTIDRNTEAKPGARVVCDDADLAANTTIPAGVLVATDATGNLVNATDTANLTVQGRAARRMANSAGAAAKIKPAAQVEAGIFKWKNAGANGLTKADLGKSAYVVDNETVGKAAATTNSVVAGTLDSIDSDGGVWVRTNC